ncbi:MAG: glycoside hydrolase family 32 protein [Clostridia bacterium]|nr:glycoside hydrolase family 32 protein [Clostridia bacterium]
MFDLNANLMQAVESSHLLRDKLLADRTRPGYHFAVPEDLGYPGDVNCCFYARGRYHLMYLYASRSDYFRYGHMSSIDLVHWRSHPDAVMPDDLDGGIFSGGAFVDDDGTCYMAYWALPGKQGGAGGVRIAKSSDRNYEVWEKFEDYILEGTEPGYAVIKDSEGNDVYVGCADPSNIWKKNGKYYIQHGALPVLIHFGVSGHPDHVNAVKNPDTPDNIKGDWVDLFESEDLHNWRWLHRFYERRNDDSWTDWNEDDMCPVFLPLPASEDGGKESGKYLQLFISHNKGCQYYIGDYDTEADLFYPEAHGRMSWKDEAFFAPEALKAPDGRYIMWAWLHDNLEDEGNDFHSLGWTGVFSMPRSLWLRKDGTLGIAPIKEMRSLRYNETKDLDVLDPLSCEIKLKFKVEAGAECGMYVHMSPDGSEYTKVYYDEAARELVMDLRNSGKGSWRVEERAPLDIKPGEKLTLDIFIDHAVVEVFANKRQAICRRAFTTDPENVCMKVISENAELCSLNAWDMMPSNMY